MYTFTGAKITLGREGERANEAAELVQDRLVAIAHAIREVYAICSPAIHGEPVSDAQVAFAEDVGPELVAALKAIS